MVFRRRFLSRRQARPTRRPAEKNRSERGGEPSSRSRCRCAFPRWRTGLAIADQRRAAQSGRALSLSNALDIRPLAGAIGAEIFGVDLADLGAPAVAAIRRAWLDHLVIFFRDQSLTPAQLLAFARRIGEPVEYPFLKGLDGFPQITPVVKLEHERDNFGGIWHSDTAYLERPPMGSMLLAREVP